MDISVCVARGADGWKVAVRAEQLGFRTAWFEDSDKEKHWKMVQEASDWLDKNQFREKDKFEAGRKNNFWRPSGIRLSQKHINFILDFRDFPGFFRLPR